MKEKIPRTLYGASGVYVGNGEFHAAGINSTDYCFVVPCGDKFNGSNFQAIEFEQELFRDFNIAVYQKIPFYVGPVASD
jgi:hypothetical protein